MGYLEDFVIWRGPLRFSLTVNDVVDGEVEGVGLVDLGVILSEVVSVWSWVVWTNGLLVEWLVR